MNTPLAEMLRYGKWANETLLESCRTLTPEQLEIRVPGSGRTVAELFTHAIYSQLTFVLRTKGRQHEGEGDPGIGSPDFDTLMEVARRSSDDLIRIAEALDEDTDVDLPYEGQSFRFPLSFFLVHAVEHGVEHRTEIKVALAQDGVETPDLDAWQFAAARRFGQAV